MAKIELTQEQKDFRLDSLTLYNDFSYWLIKSKCTWNLKETNTLYDNFRKTLDHAMSMEALKRKMFENGIK